MRIFRKLHHGLSWFIINMVGLSVAMACLLATFLYVGNELSFDKLHSKSGRIYRVTSDSKIGAASMHPARVAGDWPKQLMNEYAAIEKMVRLVPFRKAVVKIGDQRFFCQNAFSTDSTFFDIFDFKLISGNPDDAFTKPGSVMICKSLAMKYYGSTDIIGREITILHQQDSNPKTYIINGVMEDFPKNSHFHAELLTSFTTIEDRTTWAYTYFLMKEGTDMEALRNTIQKKWEKDYKDESSVQILYFQKLTDIHLFSHKTREIEKNGNIRSLILLGSGAIIILFIALINFLNLSRVQFISGMKSTKVKLIIGASKVHVASEMITKSLVLSVLSFIIGLIVAIEIGKIMGTTIFQPAQIKGLVLVALGFVIVIALISVLPLFTYRVLAKEKNSNISRNLYATPLIIQFTLSVIALTCTIGLYRQMDFLRNQHPASQNANMLVIADNPWEAVQRYETFKSELLNNTSITNVTAAMEEPGGDILDGCLFEMEGVDPKEDQSINILTTDANFFSTMGIRPIAGTTELGFTPSQQWESDAIDLNTLRNKENTNEQEIAEIAEMERKLGNYREKYILNQSALKLMGISNPQDAIGKRFRLTFFIPDMMPEGEVVGVVPDFHYTNLFSQEKPLAIVPRKSFNYCFIVSIDPLQRGKAIKTLQETWRKVNPEFPFQYEYIGSSYQKVYTSEYSQTRVLSLFALISIIISSLGILALATFSMRRRTKEIGIRKVNGARIGEIMVLLNKNFIKWVAIGFIIACPIAWYAMHKWLENFAYKTTLSWWIFIATGAVAVIVALLTVSWQTWRAATRNPVEALRYE